MERESQEQQRMEAHTRLTLLRKTIQRVSPDDPELAVIDGMLEKMRTHPYVLAVVGEFNRGKSSLINALLGMNILPADVTPTTATINRVVYGETPAARLVMLDGSEETIPFSMLKARVTKLSEEAQAAANCVREAVVSYPTVFCRNNVSLLDTPGLNESPQMDELTFRHARTADAVIFLISALAPYSQSEAASLCKLLENSSIRHVLFTVSFIDRLTPGEDVEERVLKSIRNRIQKITFPLIDRNENLSPEEKERQKAILSSALVLGVSAKKALDAFVNGSLEDLKQSRIEAYKTELMTRLTAQQDEWLAQEVTPYVRRTLSVFNDAAQRRMTGFETVISQGKALIEEAQNQLAALPQQRINAINAWALAVNGAAGTSQQRYDILRQRVERSIQEQGAQDAAPAATGWKGFAKRKGLYREEKDPATLQLKQAFEDAKETAAGKCREIDDRAKPAYRDACRKIAALGEKACQTLRQAMEVLELDGDAPLPLDEPNEDQPIFGDDFCAALYDTPLPEISVGPLVAAKGLLCYALNSRISARYQQRMASIGKSEFPEIDGLKARGEALLVRLSQQVARHQEELEKLRGEAQTIQTLL